MRDFLLTASRRLLGEFRTRLSLQHAIGVLAVGLSAISVLGMSAALSGGALSTFGRDDDRYEIDVTTGERRIFLSPEQGAGTLDLQAGDVSVDIESLDAASDAISIRLLIELSEAALDKVCISTEGVDSTEAPADECGLAAREERYWPTTDAPGGGSASDASDPSSIESLTMSLVTRFASTETQIVRFPMREALEALRTQRSLTSESVSALVGRDLRLVETVSLTPVDHSGREFYPNDIYEYSIDLVELRLTPPLQFRDDTPSDAVPARYILRSGLDSDWRVAMEDRTGEGEIGLSFAVTRSSTRRAATWLLALIPLVVVVLGVAANRIADSTAMAWGASSIAGLLSLLTVRGIAVPAEIVGVTLFDKILGVELLIGLSVAAWYLSRIPDGQGTNVSS